MKINITREGKYIPKWNDNRELAESEQMHITFRFLTYEERNKFITTEKPTITIEDFDTKSDADLDNDILRQHAKMELKVGTDTDGMLVAMDIKVVNLSDEDTDEPVDTWAKLVKIPQTKDNQIAALITEISGELSSLAKEKGSKNSD